MPGFISDEVCSAFSSTCASVGRSPPVSWPTISATDIAPPQLSSRDCAAQYGAAAAGSP